MIRSPRPIPRYLVLLFGTIVLGQGFLWSDLVSYAVGVALMAALDATLCGTAADSGA